MLLKLVTFDQLAERLGVSKQSLRRWWRAGLFPEPMRLGPRKLVWQPDVLNAWLAEQQGATAPIHEEKEIAR